MARKTTKTPAELVAELQNRIASVKAREAKELAVQNPIVAEVYSVLDSYRKDIAAYSRQLNGPQSFESRRTGFNLRLAEIAAGEALVTAQDAQARSVAEYLKNEIQGLSDRVQNGQTLTQEDVTRIVNGTPVSGVDMNALHDAFNAAHAASKAFIASKKAQGSNEVEPAAVETVTG